MVTPSCQKNSGTCHAACHWAPFLCDTGGPRSQCRHTGRSLTRASHEQLEVSWRQSQGVHLAPLAQESQHPSDSSALSRTQIRRGEHDTSPSSLHGQTRGLFIHNNARSVTEYLISIPLLCQVPLHCLRCATESARRLQHDRPDTVNAETCCAAACGGPEPAAPNSLMLCSVPSEDDLILSAASFWPSDFLWPSFPQKRHFVFSALDASVSSSCCCLCPCPCPCPSPCLCPFLCQRRRATSTLLEAVPRALFLVLAMSKTLA